MVVGPKVNKLVEEFSSVCGISPNKKAKHHEEAHATQKEEKVIKANRMQPILIQS
jgi:hypothetical protein